MQHRAGPTEKQIKYSTQNINRMLGYRCATSTDYFGEGLSLYAR